MHSWPRRLRVSCSVLSAEGFPKYCVAVFEAGRYEMWDRKALTLLRATSVQNPRIFAQCSWLEAGKGKRNQRDLALTPWAHNPKVGGSNPPPATKPFNCLHSLAEPSLAPFGTKTHAVPTAITGAEGANSSPSFATKRLPSSEAMCETSWSCAGQNVRGGPAGQP